MNARVSTQAAQPFVRNVLFSGLLLLAMGLSFIGLLYSQQQVKRAEETRYRSYLLADELRQSSDDLTRLARTFVITRNAEFEREYNLILDIRNGKQVRPQLYHRIYWDFVATDGKAPRADSGDKIPLLELMKQMGFTEDEFAKLDEAKRNSDGLVGIEVEAMGLVKKDSSPEAVAKAALMMHDARYHAEKAKIMRPIDVFYQLMEGRLDAAVVQAQQLNTVMQLLFGALALALVFMLWMTYRSLQGVVGGTVDEASRHIAAMADGDFSRVIRPTAGGEHSLLAQLADMQSRLGGLIEKVRHVSLGLAEQVSTIRQAAGAAESLSQDQARATAAMASSLDQLVVSINQASENAGDTRRVAEGTESTLDQGGAVIRGTVDSIESIASRVRGTSDNVSELNVHAQQINIIVNVIKDIADQTNLLALNAAIEAARAGEQGRGFAVVADEVRKLAERTSLSTQEITQTIGKIQQGTEQSVQGIAEGVRSVDVGVDMAKQAGAALAEIRTSADKIIAGIGDISEVLREQAGAANHVAGNVKQISGLADSSTQRIGEVSASSEKLQQLAKALADEVSHFRLAH